MKYILLFILKVLLVCLANAQVNWDWAKKIPHKHYNLIATAIDQNKYIYIAARVDSSGVYTNYHSVIYKMDSEGVILSQHAFPTNLSISDLGINDQNELFIIGQFTNNLNFGTDQFVSAGAEDLFVGKFDTNLQFIEGKSFGGHANDRANALSLDVFNNFYVCGLVSDTVNFNGTNLFCNEGGNSFLAKFDSGIQLQWVLKDSSAFANANNEYTYAKDIMVNQNNELLVTGYFNLNDFFYFNGLPITIPPLHPQGYNYGYKYAYKLDQNGNALWGHCIKETRYENFEYEGFNTSNTTIIQSSDFNGHYSSYITLLDNNGVEYKTFNINQVLNNQSISDHLGTIDDKIYFSVSALYYDSLGRHQPNHICTLTNDTLEILDSLWGETYDSELLKNHDSEYYLTGVFTGQLSVNSDTIYTNQSFTSTSGTVYYNYNPYLTKFNIHFTSINEGMLSNQEFAVYPNPTSGNIILKSTKSWTPNSSIHIYSSTGKLLLQKNIDSMSENGLSIDIGNYPKGLYLIDIISGNNNTTQKVIVQ
jgi:hypothetical protein